jgi:agmatine deiminase
MQAMENSLNTNTVYFANVLAEEYPKEFGELHKIISAHGYKVKLLVGTDDFFCRDFMPVQTTKNTFVQFVFRPEAYLKGEERSYLTDPMYVQFMTPKLTKPHYSPLILDGGNVILGQEKAIVSSRVLSDNAYQFPNKEAILQRLHTDLQREIIIIPQYPNEETGHADGLIRFINDNTVFINSTKNEPQQTWLKALKEVLSLHNMAYQELPCMVNDAMDTAEGLYINFLQVGNLIVMPQFGNPTVDALSLEKVSKAFKGFTVIPFSANWIAKEGGVFHCMSWVVME